jgi:molybdopterin-binding protein
LLLDEPLANVDAEGAPVVEKVILDLASAGATVIVATHMLEQAYHLSANVVRLEAGRVAPPAVENLLEGELVEAESGAPRVLEGGPTIDVATEKRGRARASVDPGDIVLSGRELDSSARNSLRGRVTALRERGGVVMVTADAGTAITASVTPASCRRLGLTVGSEVVLTFKATAVRVF